MGRKDFRTDSIYSRVHSREDEATADAWRFAHCRAKFGDGQL